MEYKLVKILASRSNKYAQDNMRQRNSNLFAGRKCKNISVSEMVHFIRIIIIISLEPRNMGGCVYYFQE